MFILVVCVCLLSVSAFFKTWLPFLVLLTVAAVIVILTMLV